MSHHGQQPSPDLPEQVKKMLDENGPLADELKNAQRRLQGEFPEGRLNASDDGALAVAIGNDKGKVLIHFATPVHWVGFSPKQAREIARMLLESAKQAEFTAAIPGFNKQ